MEITKQPEVKELDKKTVAHVSFTGNYMGNSEVFADLFGRLCGWAGPKGLINQSSSFLACYKDDYTKPLSPEEMNLEICITVPEETVVGDNQQGIDKQELPAGKYVVMSCELDGPQEYSLAWEKVSQWVQENNLEIDASKPSYEIYLNDPSQHPQGHHLLDICMSVK